MRRIRLGRTNREVPAVSLGTWSYGGLNTARGMSVGWRDHDDARARAALRAAHAAGITHWDTADVYGDGRSEALLGSMWGEVPRDEIFLATKVGWFAGEHPRYYHPQLIRERLERSLKLLQTEAVDLYYLHHCDFGPDDRDLEPAVELLLRLRDEGKIRWIGLSDWSDEKIVRVIERVNPDVVQPYRNVTHDTYASSGLKAWVEAHDVGVCYFSPIRHGALLGKYSAPVEFPEGDFRRNVDVFTDADVLAQLRAHAEALRAEFADDAEPVLNALLGALLADCPTGCVLLGQRSPEQVAAAARADRALSPEEAARVLARYADLAS